MEKSPKAQKQTAVAHANCCFRVVRKMEDDFDFDVADMLPTGNDEPQLLRLKSESIKSLDAKDNKDDSNLPSFLRKSSGDTNDSSTRRRRRLLDDVEVKVADNLLDTLGISDPIPLGDRLVAAEVETDAPVVVDNVQDDQKESNLMGFRGFPLRGVDAAKHFDEPVQEDNKDIESKADHQTEAPVSKGSGLVLPSHWDKDMLEKEIIRMVSEAVAEAMPRMESALAEFLEKLKTDRPKAAEQVNEFQNSIKPFEQQLKQSVEIMKETSRVNYEMFNEASKKVEDLKETKKALDAVDKSRQEQLGLYNQQKSEIALIVEEFKSSTESAKELLENNFNEIISRLRAEKESAVSTKISISADLKKLQQECETFRKAFVATYENQKNDIIQEKYVFDESIKRKMENFEEEFRMKELEIQKQGHEKKKIQEEIQTLTSKLRQLEHDCLNKKFEMENLKNECLKYEQEVNSYENLKRTLSTRETELENMYESAVKERMANQKILVDVERVKEEIRQLKNEVEADKRDLFEEKRRFASIKADLDKEIAHIRHKQLSVNNYPERDIKFPEDIVLSVSKPKSYTPKNWMEELNKLSMEKENLSRSIAQIQNKAAHAERVNEEKDLKVSL
jgi:chromosome segregation ATPase